MAEQITYTEDNIRSLDWKEHIRMRPGMYIGKLGDGKDADDGIYVLLKEVIDNSIDEYTMGHGKTIEVVIKDDEVRVRDYGRGIPLGKVVDCVSKINTGGKYDSRAFKKQSGTRAWERLAEVAPGLRPIHLDLYALYEDELDVAPPRGSSPGSTLRNPVPSS